MKKFYGRFLSSLKPNPSYAWILIYSIYLIYLPVYDKLNSWDNENNIEFTLFYPQNLPLTEATALLIFTSSEGAWVNRHITVKLFETSNSCE